MLDKQSISFIVDGIIIKVMTRYFVGDSCMQEHIREHFNGEGHTGFSKNASVTFADKTGSQKSEKEKTIGSTL